MQGLWHVSTHHRDALCTARQETQFQSAEYYFKKRILQKIHGENHLGIPTFHHPRRRIRIRHRLQPYGKGNHLQNDLKTPEKNEEAKNAHNQLKNRKDSKKTESARVREEQNREEQTKRKDDDVVPKNGGNGGITPYQSWRKQVDGLSKNQLFREMVCMRSGYSVLLNKHFDTALEEFKKHIVLLGKEERMNSQEEVRSYFTFYTQAGQRTSQELHMLLQGLEKQQSAAAPPDPYRYEQLVDGRRTYLGCPIPDGAPPRPDNTAFWNETARSWTSQTPPPSSKKPKQKPG